MTWWTIVMNWLTERGQYILTAIRSIIALLIGFKIIEVTPEQIGLIIAAMENVFGVFTAKTTVSNTRIDTITDKRVIDIMSSPDAVAARATPAEVAARGGP
jgi:hypothetical protein